MLKEFYTAALGMVNQQTRLEVAANNMANAGTSGFKREEVFVRNLMDARAHFYNVKGDVEQNDPPVGSYTDYERGAIQETGNQLDVALNSKEGFFILRDEEGKEFYSRSGRFKVDAEGNLRSWDNKFVVGDTGVVNLAGPKFMKPEQIDEDRFFDVRITDQGEIFANDIFVGNLMIAVPEDPQTLQRVSNASFIATNLTNTKFLSRDQISMKQGFLENSNVDVVSEMVEMIELQKNFESGQKVIHTNDSTLDRAIALGRYYG